VSTRSIGEYRHIEGRLEDTYKLNDDDRPFYKRIYRKEDRAKLDELNRNTRISRAKSEMLGSAEVLWSDGGYSHTGTFYDDLYISQYAKYIESYGITNDAYKIIIPEGVEKIEANGIIECNSLKRVDIYGDIKLFNCSSITRCKNLTEVHIHSEIEVIEDGGAKRMGPDFSTSVPYRVILHKNKEGTVRASKYVGYNST